MRRNATTRWLSGILTLQLLLPAAALADASDDLYQQGIQLFQAQKYAEAIDRLVAFTKEKPQRAEAHYYLGLAYYGTRQYELAILSLRKAKELAPQLELDVDYSLAAIYVQTGQTDQARSLFQKIAANTSRPDLAENAKSFLASLEQASPGAAIDPHLQAGIQAYQQKQYDQARNELEKALQAQPESVPALFYLGAVLYDTARFDDALPHFRRVLSLSPVSEWGASAQSYIETIRRAMGGPVKNWLVTLGTSSTYDENILGVNPASATSSSSSSGVSSFFLTGDIRPTDWLGLNYSFNQSLNYTASSYNYQDHMGSLYFSYPYDRKVTPAFQYMFDYGLLGGNEYQKMHRLSPSMTWRMAPGWETQLYYAYDFKNFPSFTELNGNAHEMGIGTRWSTSALSLGIRYGFHVEQANNLSVPGPPAPTFFSYSYTGHQISTDFILPLIFDVYLLLGAGYDTRRYHQLDQWLSTDAAGNTVLNQKRRVDQFINLSAGLSRRLLPNLAATLQYAYNRSISSLGAEDYTDYNYKRQTVSLVLQSDF